MLDLFHDQAAATPGAIAVAMGAASLTYAELQAKSLKLAEILQLKGAAPGKLVGLSVARSLEAMIGVLAILQSGAAYVPLDPTLPAERLQFMCEDAQLSLAVLDSASPLRQSNIETKLILQELSLACEPWLHVPASPARATDPAYVLFTSGSTGRPKGVVMTHGPLLNLIAWQQTESSLRVAARTLQFASLGFDVSFQELFSTWSTGGTLVLVSDESRSDFGKLLNLLMEAKINRLFLPYVALEHLAETAVSRQLVPGTLQEVVTAGEQLKATPTLKKFFQKLPGCRLWNHYGPTECHVVTSHLLDRDPTAWPLLPSIGRAIANTQVYVLDAWGQRAPLGVPGEIYLAGDCVAQGYLNRPDLTNEKFLPDHFSTVPGANVPYR